MRRRRSLKSTQAILICCVQSLIVLGGRSLKNLSTWQRLVAGRCPATAFIATLDVSTTADSSARQKLPRIAAGAQQTVLQSVGVAALRLVASAPVNGGLACAVEVSSPRIAVDAGRSYVLRAWMRAARGTFQRLNVSTDFFKRAPVDTTASLSRSAAPSTTLMSLPISSWLIGATGLFQ